MTSWLIGDSVPSRLSLDVNGVSTDADDTPTITVYDSSGTKKVDAQDMSHESTGEYVYYSPTTSWPVGKCFYVIAYTFSTISRSQRSMFFVYDQATWMIIDKVRGMLDNLQEGELESATIYEHYQAAQREVNNEASSSADADLLSDAIYAQTALDSYISYLTDRERAVDQIGTAAFIMLTELRLKAEKALEKVKRATKGPGEVTSGLFTTTESSMQLTSYKDMDPAAHEASKKVG